MTHGVDYRALKARAIEDLDEALAALDAEHDDFLQRVDEAIAPPSTTNGAGWRWRASS